jgi:hypothetical protein
MNPVLQALRKLGIVIGLAFVAISLWVVVIGPAILLLLKPRS